MGKQERSAATRDALVSAGAVVFSGTPYSNARIVDVIQPLGLTQGAFYFHFENKRALALEIIDQELAMLAQMSGLAMATSTDALSTLSTMSQQLGQVIQSDPVVQAGLRLTTQSADEFPEFVNSSYNVWFGTVAQIIRAGVADGSVRSDIDIAAAAEFAVTAFVGAQHIASVNPQWSGLADRLRVMDSFVLAALAAPKR